MQTGSLHGRMYGHPEADRYNMNFLFEAENMLPEISEIRHTIHMNPELGNHEYKTSALVEAFLKSCGIKTQRLTETAVMGTLSFERPGKTIAFRADMDALPVTEKTGCEFSSEVNGCMHACGHDVHTSALLAAAKLLSLHKEELSGSVRFLFEPDEEGEGGAVRMINAGCMEGVSAVYGAHMDPALPLGTAGVRFGKFYAASDMFDVTVKGKSAHGAAPEKGIDALLAAAKMTAALKELPKRFPEGAAVLSTGTFNSGTARNIVADKAIFTGIIRTLGREAKEGMISALRQTVSEISDSFGTEAEVKICCTHNGIINTDRETQTAKEAFLKISGINVAEIDKPLMTSEDFGYFIDAASAGSFYHIGAGSPHPLHSSEFLPPDEAIAVAAAAHTAVAYQELAVSK